MTGGVEDDGMQFWKIVVLGAISFQFMLNISGYIHERTILKNTERLEERYRDLNDIIKDSYT